jgi:hypothetical protein
VPIKELPLEDLKDQLHELLVILKSHLVKGLLRESAHGYEQAVLMPSHPATEKDKTAHADLTRMDEAASVLNMDGKAFDLMVAEHSGLLRKLATHKGQWCLPAWYVEELKDKKEFELIKTKYELLAGCVDGASSSSITQTPS